MLHYLERRLAWSNPAVYGKNQRIEQRVEVEHTVRMPDTERDVRIKQLLDKAAGKKPQLEIEVHEDEPSHAER